MDLSWHFFATTVLFFILYPFYGFLGLIVYLGGFFVDGDHVLTYMFENKDFRLKTMFNLKKIYTWCKEEDLTKRYVICIFHTAEFWILFIILVFFYPILIPVLLGLILHMMMDVIDMFRRKIYSHRSYSLIYRRYKVSKWF